MVLFFGHGLPASEAHPYSSWALTADELTGVDLARQLQELPAGVDTVVISDCCYGRGFFHACARVFGGGAAREPMVEPPIVCISAAGDGLTDGGIVLGAVAAELVNEVMAAAVRGASYHALEQRFRATGFAGREFHVDARPRECLERLVFGV